jgi:hypothetical protein
VYCLGLLADHNLGGALRVVFTACRFLKPADLG